MLFYQLVNILRKNDCSKDIWDLDNSCLTGANHYYCDKLSCKYNKYYMEGKEQCRLQPTKEYKRVLPASEINGSYYKNDIVYIEDCPYYYKGWHYYMGTGEIKKLW